MALSVCERNGRLLMRCHKSGCSFKDISNRLGIESRVIGNEDPEKRESEKALIGFNRVRAACNAERITQMATMRTHAYLAKKGFPNLEVPTVSIRDLKSSMPLPRQFRGLMNGDRLIVAALKSPQKKLTSVQLIDDNGCKHFLLGGRVAGSALRIGSGGHVVLCEGFATGLSIYRCSKLSGLSVMVLCCMNADNMKKIAKLAKCGSWSLTFAVADNDPSGTGAKAASHADRWVMPPHLGMDFNDFEMKDQAAAQRLIVDLISAA